MKRLHIIRVMRLCDGNISHAARVLQVRRQTLSGYVQRIERALGPLEALGDP